MNMMPDMIRSTLLRPEEPTDGRTVLLIRGYGDTDAYKVARPIPPTVTVDGLTYRLDPTDPRWTPVYRLEAPGSNPGAPTTKGPANEYQ